MSSAQIMAGAAGTHDRRSRVNHEVFVLVQFAVIFDQMSWGKFRVGQVVI